jgi:general secretion pathway protein D
VRDNSTIVIGGLIDQTITLTEYKTPCLGDVPTLGWLFRNMADSDQRSNLYVFITPHVVRDSQTAAALYEEKKESMETIEPSVIKMYEDPLLRMVAPEKVPVPNEEKP